MAIGKVKLALRIASLVWSLYRSTSRDYPEFTSPTYDPDPLRNTRSQGAPVPVAYGHNKVAGNIIYHRTHYEDEEKEEGIEGIDYLIGLCEGPVKRIDNVSADGVTLGHVKGQTYSVFGRWLSGRSKHFEVTEEDVGGYLHWEFEVLGGRCTLRNAAGDTIESESSSGYYSDTILIENTEEHIGRWRLYSGSTFPSGGSSDASATIYTPAEVEENVRLGHREQDPHEFDELQQRFPYLANMYVRLKRAHLHILESPTVTAEVRGKKVRVYDGSSWTEQNAEYSTNPAFCVLDLLTMSRTRYGMGIPDDLIDFESFCAAAEYCDEQEEFGGPTEEHAYEEKRFEYSEVLDVAENPKDALQGMLATFRAHLIPRGGKIAVFIDRASDPVQDFVYDPDDPESEDNIIAGSFRYNRLGYRQKPNKVVVEYIDMENEWERGIVRAAHDADIERSGEVREQKIQLFGIKRASQAKREARFYLKQIWFCDTFCELRAGVNSIECEVGDLVRVSHPKPGWVLKPFRVIDMGEERNGERSLVLQEYEVGIYEDENVTYEESRVPDVPDPLSPVEHVRNLRLHEEVMELGDGTIAPSIVAEWRPPVEDLYYRGGNVYHRRGTDAEWTHLALSTTNTYSIWPVSKGLHQVKVVAEKTDGTQADFDTAPVASIDIGGKTEFDIVAKWSNLEWTANAIHLNWEEIESLDFVEYAVRLDPFFGYEFIGGEEQ